MTPGHGEPEKDEEAPQRAVAPLARGLWSHTVGKLLYLWLVLETPERRLRPTDASIVEWHAFFDGLAGNIRMSWASSWHYAQLWSVAWQAQVEDLVTLDANMAHEEMLRECHNYGANDEDNFDGSNLMGWSD